MENALEKKYGLKEILITGSDELEAGESVKRQIGIIASNYFNRSVNRGDTVGVSWGTTLQAMVDVMRPRQIEDLHIVQTLGGVGPPEAKAHATDISRRLSQLFNCRLSLLPAPGIVGSREAKEVLITDSQVKTTLDLFSQIDTLFVGLGAIKTNPILDKKNGEIQSHLYNDITNSKAVGDIALHFIDLNGNEVDSKVKDLTIGISIEEMKQINTVVGIAGGSEKINIIRGALKGKLIDVLITDYQVAELLLSE